MNHEAISGLGLEFSILAISLPLFRICGRGLDYNVNILVRINTYPFMLLSY